MRSGLWIALAVFGWGSWAIFQKLAVRNMSPLLVMMTVAYVYSAFAPMMWLGMKAHAAPMEWSFWGVVWTILASLCSVSAGYAFLFAIENKPVTQVVPWIQTYPIFTLAVGWLFLGETVTVTRVVGSLLIAFGAFIMNR